MFKVVPYNRHNVVRTSSDNLNRVFDSFFNDDFWNSNVTLTKNTSADFKVDIKDSEGAFEIIAELPGIAKENVTVDYKDEMLVIKVESKEEKNEDNEGYIRRERTSRSMERRFRAKKIQADQITAKLENGLLTINVPKEVEVDNSFKIDIQ